MLHSRSRRHDGAASSVPPARMSSTIFVPTRPPRRSLRCASFGAPSIDHDFVSASRAAVIRTPRGQFRSTYAAKRTCSARNRPLVDHHGRRRRVGENWRIRHGRCEPPAAPLITFIPSASPVPLRKRRIAMSDRLSPRRSRRFRAPRRYCRATRCRCASRHEQAGFPPAVSRQRVVTS